MYIGRCKTDSRNTRSITVMINLLSSLSYLLSDFNCFLNHFDWSVTTTHNGRQFVLLFLCWPEA